MHVYQQRPDIASMGGQKAFVKFADQVSTAWDKDNTTFNEEYFKMQCPLRFYLESRTKL